MLQSRNHTQVSGCREVKHLTVPGQCHRARPFLSGCVMKNRCGFHATACETYCLAYLRCIGQAHNLAACKKWANDQPNNTLVPFIGNHLRKQPATRFLEKPTPCGFLVTQEWKVIFFCMLSLVYCNVQRTSHLRRNAPMIAYFLLVLYVASCQATTANKLQSRRLRIAVDDSKLRTVVSAWQLFCEHCQLHRPIYLTPTKFDSFWKVRISPGLKRSEPRQFRFPLQPKRASIPTTIHSFLFSSKKVRLGLQSRLLFRSDHNNTKFFRLWVGLHRIRVAESDFFIWSRPRKSNWITFYIVFPSYES